jgi:excisionase family DNA binding protein
MLTVPEAARRARCNPETVRRWIRSGCLRSRRVGTQHLIDESDLLAFAPLPARSLPAAWRKTTTGEPMPDVVRAVRRLREGR